MRTRSSSRRGFTLVELVTAMGAMSVLMLAMGSVMMVARAGVPGDDDPALAAMGVHRAAQMIAADLSMSDAFKKESDPDTWILGMPDRDGDGQRETVTYVWDEHGSGATYRLVRAENDGAGEIVLAGARLVELDNASGPVSGRRVTVRIVGRDAASTRCEIVVPMWNTQGF